MDKRSSQHSHLGAIWCHRYRNRCNQIGDFLGDFCLHARDQVPIHIQGDGGLGMSQPVRYDNTGISWFSIREAAVMAQVMKTDIRQTSFLQELLKIPEQVPVVDWCANLRGEYQTIFCPALPCRLVLLTLHIIPTLQYPHSLIA
jgi:hypothetical protein